MSTSKTTINIDAKTQYSWK